MQADSENPWQREAFRVGEAGFTLAEAAYAAVLRGVWRDLERDLLHGLACQARAREEGFEPDDGELRATMRDFRYAAGLISADEMNAWLDSQALEVDDWIGTLERRLLREHWSSELEVTGARFPVGDDDLLASLWAEAVCSGALAHAVRDLAARVAVSETLAGEAGSVEAPKPAAPASGARLSALAELARADAESLFLQFDQIYATARERALTPRAVEQTVARNRLEWIRFSCSTLWFPEESMAREAHLMITEDGDPPEAVADEVGVELRQEDLLMEQLQEGLLRNTLTAAAPGAVLPPMPRDDGFVVVQLREKALPSVDDALCRERAEGLVWDGWVGARIDEHVKGLYSDRATQ